MPLCREVALARAPAAELLAAAQWGAPPNARTPVTLDLRYVPDEDRLLRPAPRAVYASVVGAPTNGGAELWNHYAVDDPYGAERGTPVVSEFFDIGLTPTQVTFGAGVTSLLHALAGLAAGGVVAAPTLVHSDLEVWAASRGALIHLFDDSAPWDRVMAEVCAARPDVIHLDRPTFTGLLMPLEAVASLVRAAAEVGAVVVIDEAPATYLGPGASAARLVPATDNLVVLRGFTKAYSLGGIRAAFALASSAIASRVRDLIAPLQVSEPSLRIALSLLARGDVFSELVERVRVVKPEAIAVLRAAGFETLDGHRDLPWIALRDSGEASSRRLEAVGIRPLLPTTARAFPDAFREQATIRVSLPLSETRLQRFSELLQLQDAPLAAR